VDKFARVKLVSKPLALPTIIDLTLLSSLSRVTACVMVVVGDEVVRRCSLLSNFPESACSCASAMERKEFIFVRDLVFCRGFQPNSRSLTTNSS